MASDFDSLRREATKLERHLEDRVSRFQQLAQRIMTSSTTAATAASSASSSSSPNDTSDLLLFQAESGTSTRLEQEEEASLRHDLERTIKSLQEVINKLAASADQSSKPQHLLLVKRYREILLDLSSDYSKTSQALERKRQEAKLFQGRNLNSSSTGADPAMDHLLRERNHIHNSLTASAAVLDQASAVHSDLRTQGRSLRNVQGLIGKVTQNIPGLNRLVEGIRQKRSRDDKIVATVIATCILFTLWYLLG